MKTLTKTVLLSIGLLSTFYASLAWAECGNKILENGQYGTANLGEECESVVQHNLIDYPTVGCTDCQIDVGFICHVGRNAGFDPDDGSPVDRTQCTPFCGDGIRITIGGSYPPFFFPPEPCDDGANNSDSAADACRTNCTLPSCGDKVVDTGEECDPLNTERSDIIPDTCRTDCSLPSCGDGVIDVQSGELCDDGNTQPGDGCGPTCFLESCGNGVPELSEACDDGNQIAGDGCGPTCLNEECGNAFIDPGENCDDNNTTGGDGCNELCQIEFCGNGFQEGGENCDDGNQSQNDACTNQCLPNVCGDGLVSQTESCDDNNEVSGDDCSAACLTDMLLCGDGTLQSGEECDEGLDNADVAASTCRTDCRLPRCGDGVVNGNETCDGSANCAPNCQPIAVR